MKFDEFEFKKGLTSLLFNFAKNTYDLFKNAPNGHKHGHKHGHKLDIKEEFIHKMLLKIVVDELPHANPDPSLSTHENIMSCYKQLQSSIKQKVTKDLTELIGHTKENSSSKQSALHLEI